MHFFEFSFETLMITTFSASTNVDLSSWDYESTRIIDLTTANLLPAYKLQSGECQHLKRHVDYLEENKGVYKQGRNPRGIVIDNKASVAMDLAGHII